MNVFELATDREAAARAVIESPGLRIWQFNGIYPHDVTIDALASRLTSMEVIDQYAGSAPELFSIRRHIATKLELAVNKALLLDSNVSRYMRKYLAGDLKEELRADAHALLTWAAEQRVNFHPGFSLMETFSGSSDPEFHGLELIKMGLLLSGMDPDSFLRDGQIVFGSAGLSFLRSNFGTESLDAAATIQMGRLPRDMRQVVDPTYAALLKIALIEDTVPFAQFQRRVEEFWEFLEGTLRAVLSVELVTALLFFSGQIGGFIPLRASSPLAQRFADVRSSAWDIYLARMASTFISQGDESELTLPLIITGDERLKKIVRGQRLFGVISMDKQAPFPVLLTDFEYLESFVPKSWDSEWLRRRIEQRKVPAQRDEVDIQRIIADLEDQVRRRFGE
ncbi:MAG TPA: hypothetical protein VNF68_09140 [Candidatus Baltobacteraceae bacterium]|nr:hypothetical protein [Candidatus Baltobacteraceae bacterium]